MNNAEKAHLDRVSSLGCIACKASDGLFGWSDAEIHHLRRNPETGEHLGISQRASHYHTIPLCSLHHRTGRMGEAFHAGPRAWEAIHGTETELWNRVQELLKGVA